MPSRTKLCDKCGQNITLVPVGDRSKPEDIKWAYGIHWTDTSKTARCLNSLKRTTRE